MGEITVSFLSGKLETEKRNRMAIVRDLRAEIVEIEEDMKQIRSNPYDEKDDKMLESLEDRRSRAERRIGVLS